MPSVKYKLSSAAARDIEEIYLYGYKRFDDMATPERSPGFAKARAQTDHYAAMVENRIAIICADSRIGRIDSRVNPEVRRSECERHVIFYDLLEDHILIVRILHGVTDYVQHLGG